MSSAIDPDSQTWVRLGAILIKIHAAYSLADWLTYDTVDERAIESPLVPFFLNPFSISWLKKHFIQILFKDKNVGNGISDLLVKEKKEKVCKVCEWMCRHISDCTAVSKHPYEDELPFEWGYIDFFNSKEIWKATKPCKTLGVMFVFDEVVASKGHVCTRGERPTVDCSTVCIICMKFLLLIVLHCILW